MSSARDSYSMSMSPSPPSDIGTYSRSMHQHTKRQMEAASSRRSSGSSSGGGSSSSPSNSGPSAMPNGVSSRSRNNNTDQFGYQS